MIILFHYLSFLIIKLLRDKGRIKSTQNLLESNTTKPSSETNSPVVEHADLENQIKFDPPLYRQRYGSVYETLLDERWRTKVYTLVDFGCSEFGLFVFVKRLNHLSKILFVDIDEEMLRQYTGKLLPLTIDYIRRRQGPLDINVFLGSVSDPDYRLVNVDAVSAVELIEHLYPDTLDAFPYNVFQYIKPKLVMVTTPNSDFNVLFPKRDGFRHFDHKFEWSREQFQDWANNIIIRFPNYTVSFSGLGEGPAGTEHLGQCSQMAVFVRNDLIVNEYVSETCCVCICASASPCRYSSSDSKLLCSCVCALCSPSASFGVCTYLSHSKRNAEQDPKHNVYYKLIKEVDYPVDFDNRTEDEKMADELQYRISTLGRAWGRFYVEEQDRSEIPLQDVTYGANGFSITESELGKVLIRLGYKVEECRIQETGLIQTCVIYEPVMEDISDTSEASGYDSDFTKHQLNGESLSDWDEPHVKKDGAKTSSTSEEFPEDEAFPLWLLQILGTQVIVEGDIAAAVAGTAQEEPHFYCQGDGLGVHPSVIAVEVDEEEDTTDSSNNTTDFAEVEQGLSTQDVSSLHDESSGIPMENQEHEGEEQPETEQHEHLGSSSSMDPGGSA